LAKEDTYDLSDQKNFPGKKIYGKYIAEIMLQLNFNNKFKMFYDYFNQENINLVNNNEELNDDVALQIFRLSNKIFSTMEDFDGDSTKINILNNLITHIKDEVINELSANKYDEYDKIISEEQSNLL